MLVKVVDSIAKTKQLY